MAMMKNECERLVLCKKKEVEKRRPFSIDIFEAVQFALRGRDRDRGNTHK